MEAAQQTEREDSLAIEAEFSEIPIYFVLDERFVISARVTLKQPPAFYLAFTDPQAKE